MSSYVSKSNEDIAIVAWIAEGRDQIEIMEFNTKSLQDGKPIAFSTVDSILSGPGQYFGTICATQVEFCPKNNLMLHIVSVCPDSAGSSQFYSRILSYEIGAEPIRADVILPHGSASVRVCPLGSSYAVMDSHNEQLYLVDTQGSRSQYNVDIADLGLSNVQTLYCLKANSQYAIASHSTASSGTGTHQDMINFGVFYGNELLNAQRRTNKISVNKLPASNFVDLRMFSTSDGTFLTYTSGSESYRNYSKVSYNAPIIMVEALDIGTLSSEPGFITIQASQSGKTSKSVTIDLTIRPLFNGVEIVYLDNKPTKIEADMNLEEWTLINGPVESVEVAGDDISGITVGQRIEEGNQIAGNCTFTQMRGDLTSGFGLAYSEDLYTQFYRFESGKVDQANPIDMRNVETFDFTEYSGSQIIVSSTLAGHSSHNSRLSIIIVTSNGSIVKSFTEFYGDFKKIRIYPAANKGTFFVVVLNKQTL